MSLDDMCRQLVGACTSASLARCGIRGPDNDRLIAIAVKVRELVAEVKRIRRRVGRPLVEERRKAA